MKRLPLVTLITSLLLTLPAAAHVTEFVGTDDYVTTNMCVLAAADKKLQFIRLINSYPMKYNAMSRKFIANNIKCNGINITEFAKKYNAKRTYAFLSRYYNN